MILRTRIIMSFFKKVLSSVGIGSAKVDTIIHNPEVAPTQILSGTVQVDGGSTLQHINHIKIHVCCNYFSEETETDEDDNEHERIVEHTALLASYKVSGSFDVEEGQNLSFDFDIPLPANTPLSLGQSRVWVDTDLDIDYAFDKSDKDMLHVVPNERQNAVLVAMSQLGFALGEVENEASSALGTNFVQEFEFKAYSGDFKGRVDEVEMLMVNHDESLELMVEVDRKAKGLEGFFASLVGRDETKLWVEIQDYDADSVINILHQAIDEHC